MKFRIYKNGQGKYTRLWSGLGIGVVSVIGCWRLHERLGGLNVSQNVRQWVEVFVPVGLFAALGLLVFWLLNRANVADFMISAEGELKKVSWSSRQEIAVSTTIVIFVVIFMACLMGATDIFFELFFRSIGLGG
ncbi:MAG: preprotein translocase subunit SecE [Planctomycetota bacterium]